jgi:hypothetical protein
LPWNPARLEQRIGRVDRISQKKPTHFTLLVAQDDAETGLLAHLARRILTARRSVGNDALASVAPPEDAVRRALLFREGSETDPGVDFRSLVVCRRWERLALRAAESLARRRRLAAAWRAPDPPRGAVFCRHPRVAHLVPSGFQSLFVFSVPVLDAADVLIDRLIVPIAARAPADDARLCRVVADAMKHRVIAAARRRIRAIARQRRSGVDSRAARERAIADAVANEFGDRELQPGLFDQRDVHAFDASERDIADARAAADRGARQAALGADVRAGEPILELVVSRDK